MRQFRVRLYVRIGQPHLGEQEAYHSYLHRPRSALINTYGGRFVFRLSRTASELPLRSNGERSYAFFPEVGPLQRARPRAIFIVGRRVVRCQEERMVNRIRARLREIHRFIMYVSFSVLRYGPSGALLVARRNDKELSVIPKVGRSIRLMVLSFVPIVAVCPSVDVRPSGSN